MGVLSQNRLVEAMLSILLKLPMGLTNLKETIVRNLGIVGSMTSTREIDQAWTQVKKKAAKLHPEKFILDNRNNLSWNDGAVKVSDKNISSPNFKKLNELAAQENCTVNALVSRLIKAYNK
jgi:predicted DNA-binding ribbon-helix-helix protein